MANDMPKFSEVFELGTEVTYEQAVSEAWAPFDNAMKSVPSISPIETCVLLDNKIIPTSYLIQIELPPEVTSGILNFIDQSAMRDGATLSLRIKDNTNPITIKNGVSGSGGILTTDGNDVILNDFRNVVSFQREGTIWRQAGGISAQADWEETDTTKASFIKNKPEGIITESVLTQNIDENSTEDEAPSAKASYDLWSKTAPHNLGEIFTDGFVGLLEGQGWCQGDVLPSGAYGGLVAEFEKYQPAPIINKDLYVDFSNNSINNTYNVEPLGETRGNPVIADNKCYLDGSSGLYYPNLKAGTGKWFRQCSFKCTDLNRLNEIMRDNRPYHGAKIFINNGEPKITITYNNTGTNSYLHTEITSYTITENVTYTIRQYFTGSQYKVDICLDWDNSNLTGTWENISTFTSNEVLGDTSAGMFFGSDYYSSSDGLVGTLENIYVTIGSSRLIKKSWELSGIAWIDFSTYEASLLANNNNCILFGYDVVNNLIRLPTIQDGVGIFQANTIAENNKFYNDQLQNITGTIGAGNGQAFQGRNPVNNYTNNGALSLENASNKIGATGNGTADNCFDVAFDASRVARTGDYTRNKQLRRRYKVQLANVGVPVSESQYEGFVDGLTNKADKDLGNVSAEGKETVVGWGMPDYSAGILIATTITTTEISYTAPSDGIITSGFNSGGANSVFIKFQNGNSIACGTGTANNSFLYFAVNKGETIKIKTDTITAVGQLIFYPLKGVN